MSLVQQFRLTSILYNQVRSSGKSPKSILRKWDEGDYNSLCDYIQSCRGVLPKYIKQTAELIGESPRRLVREILEARDPVIENFRAEGNRQKENDFTFMLEDTTDTTLFIQDYCNSKKQFM